MKWDYQLSTDGPPTAWICAQSKGILYKGKTKLRVIRDEFSDLYFESDYTAFLDTCKTALYEELQQWMTLGILQTDPSCENDGRKFWKSMLLYEELSPAYPRTFPHVHLEWTKYGIRRSVHLIDGELTIMASTNTTRWDHVQYDSEFRSFIERRGLLRRTE
jgi:hypothetical protein